jgi:hypothetical protein
VTDQDFCAYEDPSESLMFGGSRNWSGGDGPMAQCGKEAGATTETGSVEVINASLADAGNSTRAGASQASMAPRDESTERKRQAGIKSCLQFLEQPNASSRGHVCNPAGCEGVQPSSDEQTAEWKEGLPHPSTSCDSQEGDR